MPLAEASRPVRRVTSSKSSSGPPEPVRRRYWSHGRVVSGVAQTSTAPRMPSTRRPRRWIASSPGSPPAADPRISRSSVRTDVC